MKIFDNIPLKGWSFSLFKEKNITPFEKLFEIFKELITYTSGDFDEAIDWLRQLDKEYLLTDENYTIDDFIEDLLQKGFINAEISSDGDKTLNKISAKMEKALRKFALKKIFGKIKKSRSGNHKSKYSGSDDDDVTDYKNYQYGDQVDKIIISESLKNMYSRTGNDELDLISDDIVVRNSSYNSQMSTVLMIDISHSMILYGEDRITPAKKVAMALAELIITRYPKDTLDILVFGNDAKIIPLKQLPYLKVGPYHTNTVAGLQLAMDILKKKKNNNKQILMITDGKPSCLKLSDGSYYKNSSGLDSRITNKCYNMAKQAKKLNIPITTFMIARDAYLQHFVREFAKANNGKAFYTGLDNLGEMIFEDYESNRKRKI
ncbi:MAG: VWA domain-containing protein [Cryomorphaceae bacterium]|nr:MAG: VWA domain-containing protein [Cryomorphaceae bacterium]|tara:strand:- start:809 stop:1936 length:1128 start_codon:yes stop_codon:yes gene_type:complete